MTAIDFKAFDADNHYYEAEDAFTRHMDPKLARHAVQWATIRGRKRLVICGKVDKFIPNPTFDPVARPGSLDEYFRGRNPESKDMASLFGELEPISPAYRDRDARLALMDQQGLEGALLFPTQGVGVEQRMTHNARITHATLHAFNEWLHDDWGFHYQDRIFAAPMISLMDTQRAVEELEWCLERDARIVILRAAPVSGAGETSSPGDPRHDPFWARVNEAGICVGFHAGDSGYGAYAAEWEAQGDMEAFRHNTFGNVTQPGRSTYDTLAALIVHGVFKRHPHVRVCSIENGAEWVSLLLHKLKKAYGQMPKAFAEDPIETFRNHIFIAPYYEDDIRELADQIGTSQVLMGSDFPHAEGLADPVKFADELHGFDDREIRAIMRDNTRKLVEPGWRRA